MAVSGFELAKAFEKDELCGWAEHRHPGIARSEFNLLKQSGYFLPFSMQSNAKGTKTFLHLVARKVLGKDITNYNQQIGDCVSFAGKNAAELLQTTQILLGGDDIKWRPVFPPYYYGASRVYVGRGRLGNDDGSLGSWLAQAVVRYGTLFADEANVPKYSGKVAKAWGDPQPKNDLDNWLPTAKNFLVQGVAQVRTWANLVEAISSGFPVTIASDVGFEMEARKDGFHRIGRKPWAHAMCVIGADDNAKDPYVLILNSWGDCHGHLKDFDDGHSLPKGVLRVRRADFEKILRQKECFAYSDMRGFQDRREKLQKAMFDLLGKQD